MSDTRPVLAIIGGTGALGLGLAGRFAAAGYPVILGSRSAERAQEAAGRVRRADGGAAVRGLSNAAAARAAEIVILAVPYAGQVATVQMPPEGCAALAAQARLGGDVRVVSAFHNVAAHKLQAGGSIDCDVLVFGNDRAAREVVIALVEAIGLRGLDAGPLANSIAAEAMTSVLIGMNRRYKSDGAGLRITGIPAPSTAA
jgi:predicted dinucleotide-binding enzyme